MMLLLLFASLCFKFASCQGGCGTLVPQDGCGREVKPCVGRSSIQLQCSSSQLLASVQWHSVQGLNDDGTLSLSSETNANHRTASIQLSSEERGYWWCSADITEKKSCNTITALHLYPCSCRSINSTIFQRICPSSSRANCNLEPRCRSDQSSHLCLSTTQLFIFPSTTEALSHETASTMQDKTESQRQALTLDTLPTRTRHTRFTTTNTTLPLQPSSITSLNGKEEEDGMTRTTGMPSINTVQLLLYIVGPVVVLLALLVVTVLLFCVICLRYKRKKQRDRRPSNSSGRCGSLGPIYDNVGPGNNSIRIQSNFSYIPRLTNNMPSPYETPVAADYEVPVIKHSRMKTENSHSQSTSSMNPVFLDLCTGQGVRDNVE